MREKNIPLTAKELVSFIKTGVTNAGFSWVVGNVSGGIDSATATALASAALEPQNVFALLLPYKDWHTEASRQARQLLHNLEISSSNIFEIDLAPIVYLQSGILISNKG